MHLPHLVHGTTSFVKDTTHFLINLDPLGQLPSNTILFTLDVDACQHFLDTRDRSTSTIRTEALCDLLRMILNMNIFDVNNNYYIQKHGTAMGTRMAPSCANLFLPKFETDALLHAPHQPHTWWRFIEDIFMIWTYTENDLLNFISYLHPTITLSHSSTSISFLDVQVSFNRFGIVETDLYTKPTDKHQYLHVTPYAPNEPFHSASPLDDDTYAFLTRLLHYELMNLSNTFMTTTIAHSSNTRSSEFMLSHAMKHSNPVRPHPTNPVAFLLSSHATLPVSSIIQKQFSILSSSPRCTNVFTSVPLVAN